MRAPDTDQPPTRDAAEPAGRGATPAGYFTAMYAGADDPWSLATRWYERRKHALTVASLGRERYRSAFEPGCSVGALTALLAPRCDALLATDRVPAALATAASRLGDRPGLRFAEMVVPETWPDGRFDLVVLSEMAYYLDSAGLDRLLDAATGSVDAGGELVAVHWRHPVAEHALTGDAVHARLRGRPELSLLAGHAEDDFLLDVFVRRDDSAPAGAAVPGVAAREGLC